MVKSHGARLEETGARTEDTEQGFDLTVKRESIGQVIQGLDLNRRQVYLILEETLGQGEPVLGKKLLGGFLKALADRDSEPGIIILLNTAVNHACAGSELINFLLELTAKNWAILVCSQSVTEQNLKGQLLVGETVSLYTIVEVIGEAGKVVTL